MAYNWELGASEETVEALRAKDMKELATLQSKIAKYDADIKLLSKNAESNAGMIAEIELLKQADQFAYNTLRNSYDGKNLETEAQVDARVANQIRESANAQHAEEQERQALVDAKLKNFTDVSIVRTGNEPTVATTYVTLDGVPLSEASATRINERNPELFQTVNGGPVVEEYVLDVPSMSQSKPESTTADQEAEIARLKADIGDFKLDFDDTKQEETTA